MINLLHKLAIFKYINANKDQVEYNFKYDIAHSMGVHVVEIENNGSLVIYMHKNSSDTFFLMKYDLQKANPASRKIVRPCQQNCFDELFISKMYHKMLNNYIAKNGMPHNVISR